MASIITLIDEMSAKHQVEGTLTAVDQSTGG
jgi:hypothetical protein